MLHSFLLLRKFENLQGMYGGLRLSSTFVGMDKSYEVGLARIEMLLTPD